MTTQNRFGLRKHRPSTRDLRLTDVYTGTVDLPGDFGAVGLDWQMFGNDRFGNCYWVSAAHEVMAEAHLAGRDPVFDTQNVLDTYARYLGLPGYEGLTQRNDLGSDAREGAAFRKAYGIADAVGHGHRIGAYTFIEEPDYELIKSALYDFGGCTVCLNLPYSAEEAFDKDGGGFCPVWDYVPGSPLAGGHAVAGVSVRGGDLHVVSWGREVTVTESFIERYLQCVVVYVSGSALSGGVTVNGLDRAALKQRLANL